MTVFVQLMGTHVAAPCKWSILGLRYDELGDGQADACR